MDGRKPTALKVVCVTAIVLGSLLSCTGLLGVGGLAMQGVMANQQERALAELEGDPAQGGFLAFNQQLQDLQRRWLPVSATLAFGHIVIAVALIVGGALTLALKPGGRSLLMTTLGLGAVFELARTGFESYLAVQTQEVMQRMTLAAGPDPGSGGSPPGMPDVGMFMAVGMGVSLAMAGCWGLLKIAFYLWSLFYLRKPGTRDLFAGTGLVANPPVREG